MSELKAFTFGLGQYTEDGSPCVVAFDGEKNPRLASDEKFYLKSEADKVIAELEEKHKTEVKELLCLIRDKENNFNRAFDSEEKEIRHHKYKRCLAMAMYCHNQREIYERDSYDWELEYDAIDTLRNKANIMRKWRKRWLELAEKFKEAK